MKTMIILTMLAYLVAVANAYSHHMGACPDAKPLDGFEMEKFLGYWHVIEKASGSSKCDGYNYTRDDEPGKYTITQDTDRQVLGISSWKYRVHYSGNLTVPGPSTPARMEVRFPFNVAGAASYIVFATDYINYAGVLVCQNLGFSHRRNVAILSRSKELNHTTLNDLHQQLENFGITGDQLNSVPQTECDVNENLVDLKINAKTFSNENVRKIWSKFGKVMFNNWLNKMYQKILGTNQELYTERETAAIADVTTPQYLGENLFNGQF